MKAFLKVCVVLACVVFVLAASPLTACDRVSAFGSGFGSCAAVQAFAVPAVQAQAVFAQPVYQTQQVVQVPVQAPVVFQSAYAVQSFAVAHHPVVQQVNVVRNRQPRVTRSVAKVRTRR